MRMVLYQSFTPECVIAASFVVRSVADSAELLSLDHCLAVSLIARETLWWSQLEQIMTIHFVFANIQMHEPVCWIFIATLAGRFGIRKVIAGWHFSNKVIQHYSKNRLPILSTFILWRDRTKN